MAIKAVLFDLDGTLLPMDQEVFMKFYFGELSKRLVLYGYEPKKLIDSVFAGIKSMVKNDGTRKNEEAFWETFSEFHGEDCRKDEPIFDSFYRNEFEKAKGACGFEPKAKEVIEFLITRKNYHFSNESIISTNCNEKSYWLGRTFPRRFFVLYNL